VLIDKACGDDEAIAIPEFNALRRTKEIHHGGPEKIFDQQQGDRKETRNEARDFHRRAEEPHGERSDTTVFESSEETPGGALPKILQI
jgi:hypothetical protein